MALSAAQLAVIRSWVGATPDDPDLQARYDRLGTVEAVALEVLRERRANLLASPAKFDVDGDYSQDATANLKELSGSISDLEGQVSGATPAAVSTGRLVRANRLR